MAKQKRTPGLIKVRTRDGGYIWHIDKRIKGYGRLCESTGTSDLEEAEQYLAKRVAEIRKAVIHGVRPKRTFAAAAARYLTENAHKRGIGRDAEALEDMMPFIGEKYIDEIHDGSFDAYRKARRNPTEPRPGRKKIRPLANSTLNRNIAAAVRVLKDAATKWRDERTGLTWLETAPWIDTAAPHKSRGAYPLDWDEQRLLFSELPGHLATMALFAVNTGLRDEVLCALEWDWEIRIPELDTPTLKRSVFVVPPGVAKCRTGHEKEHLLVLNDVAQSIIESVRGQHPKYVFVCEAMRRDERTGKWRLTLDRLYSMRTSAWLRGRERAAARYQQEFGRPAPWGFRNLRVHDLRHTFGRRLRAAGVSLEDRQDLLWHEAGRITTHYSAAEIANLIAAANKANEASTGRGPTVLRVLSGEAGGSPEKLPSENGGNRVSACGC